MKNHKIITYVLSCLAILFLIFGVLEVINPNICYTIALTSVSLANIWNGIVALRKNNRGFGMMLIFAGIFVLVLAYTIFIAPLMAA